MNPARVNASAPPASASTYVCRFSGRNALSTSRFSQLECALWSFQLGSHRFHQDWDRGRSPPFQKRKKKRSGRKSQTYITSLNCFLYTIIKMLFSSFLFPKSISNFGVFFQMDSIFSKIQGKARWHFDKQKRLLLSWTRKRCLDAI